MYANMDGSGSDEESEEDGVLGLRDVDGYHDAQNDLDAEADEDFDRVMSGGLSESSGHVETDVYDYKVSYKVMSYVSSFEERAVLCLTCFGGCLRYRSYSH